MTVDPREKGAALLTVLLLVAVMAAVAATALDRLGLSTRLALNSRQSAQARAWLSSAELIALTRVEDLRAAQPKRVTLAGNWLGVARTIALPDGSRVEARIFDGGNCFNLNALVRPVDQVVVAPRPDGQLEFAALMTSVGIEPARAARIAAAATDYIDDDDVPQPGGVEQAGYPSGFRPANRPMADRSELRAVPGVTAGDYRRLEKWVCALPAIGRSPVNVNTLRPEEAPLLAMFYQGKADVNRAREAIVRRPPGGVDSADALFGSASLSGLPLPDAARTQAGVATDYFELRSSVRAAAAGGADIGETALIEARDGKARILARQWGSAS